MKAVVRISGGIGNQIFQIGFGDFLKRKYNFEIVYDISSYTNTSSPNRKFVGDLLFPDGNYENKTIIDIEQSFELTRKAYRNEFLGKVKIIFQKILYLIKDQLVIHNSEIIFWGWNIFGSHINHVFIGNWQDFHYLSKEFKDEIHLNLVKVAKPLIALDLENDIGIHIRRGDYLDIGSIHKVIEDSYYVKALSIFKQSPGSRRILLFSDDDSCELNLGQSGEVTHVNNFIQDDLTQLLVMSSLRNLVIANSTFSAVAALIGGNEKQIVAPINWYREGVTIDMPLLPATWHHI